MKIVSVIPVKLNNERLPGKNTKCFSDGTPLIACILKTICEVPELDEIYVYCSDPDIQEYFPNNKIKYLCRSKSLDQSSTKINEVLRSFAENIVADIYVLTHATAPFIRKERFSEGIRAVRSGEYDSALAVTEIREFLWKDGTPWNYDPSAVPRTQDLVPVYAETSGMYVYSYELIKRENRRIGHNPYLVLMSQIESIDVDEPEDFVIADAIYTNILKLYVRGGGIT